MKGRMQYRFILVPRLYSDQGFLADHHGALFAELDL